MTEVVETLERQVVVVDETTVEVVEVAAQGPPGPPGGGSPSSFTAIVQIDINSGDTTWGGDGAVALPATTPHEGVPNSTCMVPQNVQAGVGNGVFFQVQMPAFDSGTVSHEPIVVARKPLSGTVAANLLEHGTGALNIDGCRIAGTARAFGNGSSRHGGQLGGGGTGESRGEWTPTADGRWPANLTLSHSEDCVLVGQRRLKGDPRDTGNGRRGGGFVDTGAAPGDGEPNARLYGDETTELWACVPGCPVRALDEQSGEMRARGNIRPTGRGRNEPNGWGMADVPGPINGGDTGGASRFFYCAKASRAERNAGLQGFEEVPSLKIDPTSAMAREGRRGRGVAANGHPTVKPIDLMRWLVRLVTPPGGTVLDPFAGSGTTGIAAVLKGFDFIGIERDPEYARIARARIEWWAQHPEGLDLNAALQGDVRRRKVAESGQGSLLDGLGEAAA